MPEPPLVLDASPLIALSSAGILDRVFRLKRVFLFPPEIQEEVLDRGRDVGTSDIVAIESALDEGRLQVARVRERRALRRLRENPRLSAADAAALALALERKAILVSDDRDLRSAARAAGVPVQGSLALLSTLTVERLLSSVEAVEVARRMVTLGWYCSPALLASFEEEMRGV